MLGLIVVLLFGLSILLVKTWPWWLLAVEGLLAALFLSKTFRIEFAGALKGEIKTSDANEFRSSFGWLLATIGIIAGAGCLITLGSFDLGWWLVPMSLMALACTLLKLIPTANSGSIGGIVRHSLSSNFGEFFNACTLVLSVYLVACLWLVHLSLNHQTRETLIRWEGYVESTHKSIECHADLGLWLLLCLCLVVVIRIAVQPGPEGFRWLNRMINWLLKTFKWAEFGITVVTLAAGVTFLASGEGGAASRIGLTLRQADKEYDQFQSSLAQRVDRAMREALVSKAINDRPAELTSVMNRFIAFDRARTKYDQKQKLAELRFELKPGEAKGFPSSSAISDEPDQRYEWVSLPTLLSITPSDTRALAAENASGSENSGETEGDNAFIELVKENFNNFPIASYLFDQIPALDLIKLHYPVWGAFLEAVSSSISESAFETIRTRIVGEATAEALQSHKRPSDASLLHRSALALNSIVFDWTPFDPQWQGQALTTIENYDDELVEANARVDAAVKSKQPEVFNLAIARLREKIELMR